MDTQPERYERLVGITIIACLITGLAGLFVAFWAFNSGDTMDAGIALTSSALAFGLTLNALLRQ